MYKILNKLKNIPWYIWILSLIILLGIFLRTYHFQSWLDFEKDQIRDVTLVSKIVKGQATWPLFGPTMRGSANLEGNLFHIGPIYYYFQIISAQIFGSQPDKLAYPDLLFSILIIPLLFYFLKKYFSVKLSLALTGLYTISYFAIKFSRFAWNPNLIPFFTILLLFSLYEFLVKKEKISWRWVMGAGIAIGVGVQLHIITLVLFSAISFLIFLYLLIKNKKTWKKIVTVILIALILNFGQIFSELRTGFKNTKVLLHSSELNKSTQEKNLATKLKIDADCQIEANAYMISSAGLNKCNYSYLKIFKKKKARNFKKAFKHWDYRLEIFLIFLFSLFGYGLLIYKAIQEKNEKKKYFLNLLILYSGLSFLIMLPSSDKKFGSFRYYIHLFFLPYLFLGLLIQFSKKYLKKKYFNLGIIVLSFFLLTNIITTSSIAKELYLQRRSNVHFAILGEMNSMVNYLIEKASPQKTIYLVGDKLEVNHFFHAFYYLAKQRGKKIINIRNDKKKITAGHSIFYLTDKIRKGETQIAGYKIMNYKAFGQVVIYQLQGF